MGRTRLYKTNADRQRSYRRRQKLVRRKNSDAVTHIEHRVDSLRQLALVRFSAEPSKCFQRHIRELVAEHDPRAPLSDYKRAHVSQISNRLAAHIIRRFEWLATMATDTRMSYGLWPSASFHSSDDLLGAVCFNKGANRAALEGVAPYESAMILARGACSMRAGRNGASFLISRACKIAARDHGITHFLAYSDPDAGERGTIYKALNWKCLGVAEQGIKISFVNPKSCERISSYDFNRRNDNRFFALGWNGVQSKYSFLRSLGWREVQESKKVRWLWVVPTTTMHIL
jgi:hypothetical protein